MMAQSIGRWIDTSENGELSHLSQFQSSEAARRNQIQLLELSQQAVREVGLDCRNHTSATMTFDLDKMPEAIEAIKKFRRDFGRKFNPKETVQSVYALQISLFPLTKST
jgi:uncharacterized protein (TIGR02147 family)